MLKNKTKTTRPTKAASSPLGQAEEAPLCQPCLPVPPAESEEPEPDPVAANPADPDPSASDADLPSGWEARMRERMGDAFDPASIDKMVKKLNRCTQEGHDGALVC
jgi:hypothetical protein